MIGYILLLYLGEQFQLGAFWQTICAIGLFLKFAELILSLLKS